ncbi:heat shock protein [Escherichia coli]|uniref:Heat shock protein n=1 Tax=Escherichia coli TaxID=562 RepID=A0A376TYS7_ECOLX|nr:heat shock protein [Escherichia coli]
MTVYDPQDVEFKCTCSRERCADALKTLPDEEVDSILAEDGEIDMHCDYCGNHYLFNAMDIAEIPQQRVSGRSASSLMSMSGREGSAGFYDVMA